MISSPILRSVTVARSNPVKEASGAGRAVSLGLIFFQHIIHPYREIRTSNQSVARSSRDGRLLTARIEQTQPALLAVSAFISQGTRLIQNLRRAFEAAGKPSIFAFVHCSPKPTNGLIYRLFFSPNNLSWLAAHDEQHATKEIPNVGIAVGEFGNV